MGPSQVIQGCRRDGAGGADGGDCSDLYGSADRLRLSQIERPVIAAGEVLVQVRAAGVDRGTCHLMRGEPYLAVLGFGFRGRRPRPGADVAGTVAAVGADVTRFQPGDEVFGIARGSFAEYAAAREDKLVRKPAGLSFEQAAVVAVSGLAAIKGLRAGRIAAGQKVLIIGASGGVGTYAVQLAKAFGAKVTGVASTAKWSGPLDRRRRGHRLHPGGLRRRPPALRPDPRHRRQQPSVTAPAGTHSQGDARHRWQRRRQVDRGRAADPCARALAARATAADHVHL